MMFGKSPKLEIAKAVTVSTGHITVEDSNLLSGMCILPANTSPFFSVYKKSVHGWFVYFSSIEDDLNFDFDRVLALGFSSDFCDLLRCVLSAGCYFMVLDCDGPEIIGLKTFDW